MKRWHWVLLLLPLITGALYLRALASWRPKRVFAGAGPVVHLTFSSDGKTLLVAQDFSNRRFPHVTALDGSRNFTTKWTHTQTEYLGRPRFFAGDTRVLLDRYSLRVLDASTGQKLRNYGGYKKAAVSPDGKWLAYNGEDKPVGMAHIKMSQSDVVLEPTSLDGHNAANRLHKIVGKDSGWADAFAFAPNGKTLVIEVTDYERQSSHLDFYDVKTWKRTRVIPDLKLSSQPFLTRQTLQWSRNGQFLLTSYHISNITSIGSTPPIRGISSQTRVCLWRVSDGKKLAASVFSRPFGEPPFPYNALQLQDDGRVLALGLGNRIFLDNITNLGTNPKPLLALPSRTITTAALAPDGSYLVAGTKNGQVIYKRIR